MKGYERQALLDRVERESATVGASIPERLEVEGTSIQLKERILDLQQATTLTDEQERECEQLLVALRRKRTTLLERLEEADMDLELGEQIASRIVDIDRARAALRSAGSDADIEEEIRQQQVADAERWRAFVRQSRQGIDRGLGR